MAKNPTYRILALLRLLGHHLGSEHGGAWWGGAPVLGHGLLLLGHGVIALHLLVSGVTLLHLVLLLLLLGAVGHPGVPRHVLGPRRGRLHAARPRVHAPGFPIAGVLLLLLLLLLGRVAAPPSRLRLLLLRGRLHLIGGEAAGVTVATASVRVHLVLLGLLMTQTSISLINEVLATKIGKYLKSQDIVCVLV